MSEYMAITIEDAVHRINKNIFLPDIQRSFVWDEGQIYKLFDSLMRRYPISTMLFWKLSKEGLERIQVKDGTKIKMYKFVDSNKQKSQEELPRDKDEYHLILDGQQRLTSLFIALKGRWIEKRRGRVSRNELHFNVLSGEEENEDGIRYEFEFKEDSGFKVLVEKDDGGVILKLWVNVKRIFESDLGQSRTRRQFVEGLLDGAGLSPELFDFVEDKIGDLNHALRTQKAISYFPEKEDDYEKVLDIFVRTNSGGTKLGFSDLLFSRIKAKWGEARERFDELGEDMRINNIEFDIDFILKTCLVLFAAKAEDMRYNRVSNLNDALIQQIKSRWDGIRMTLFLVRDLLKNEFRIGNKKLLSSFNALIPIAYWFSKRGMKAILTDSAENIENRRIIKKWLVKALLSGAFGGQADSVLFKAKEAIDNNISSAIFPADEIERNIGTLKGRGMKLDESIIDGFRYQSKESHLFLILCYGVGIDFEPKIERHMPEQDHIFSKKELRDKGYASDSIDSIYNIRFVSLKDNRSKKDAPYGEWMDQLGDSSGWVREKHFIPDGDWTVEKYEEFLDARKKLLLRQLRYNTEVDA